MRRFLHTLTQLSFWLSSSRVTDIIFCTSPFIQVAFGYFDTPRRLKVYVYISKTRNSSSFLLGAFGKEAGVGESFWTTNCRAAVFFGMCVGFRSRRVGRIWRYMILILRNQLVMFSFRGLLVPIVSESVFG